MNDSFGSKFEAHIERVIADGNAPASAAPVQPGRDDLPTQDIGTGLSVCVDCGHIGPAVTVTRGDFRTEALLWLALVLPGVVYSVWRLTTRGPGCALCQGRRIIPAASPIGRKLIEELGEH